MWTAWRTMRTLDRGCSQCLRAALTVGGGALLLELVSLFPAVADNQLVVTKANPITGAEYLAPPLLQTLAVDKHSLGVITVLNE